RERRGHWWPASPQPKPRAERPHPAIEPKPGSGRRLAALSPAGAARGAGGLDASCLALKGRRAGLPGRLQGLAMPVLADRVAAAGGAVAGLAGRRAHAGDALLGDTAGPGSALELELAGAPHRHDRRARLEDADPGALGVLAAEILAGAVGEGIGGPRAGRAVR